MRAMELDEAGGKRFFVTAGYFANTQIVEILRRRFPELEGELPRGEVGLREGGMPAEGQIYGFDNERSWEVLGIEYRGLEECVVDTVKSLRAVEA